MDMLIFDPFLGENLIKCLFRYFSSLPEYVKSIFIEMYIDTNTMLHEGDDAPDVSLITSRMEAELNLKVNLRLTHFPTSIKRIDPKALLQNNLLQNHGQLVQIKFARVISVFPPSHYVLRRTKTRMCKCHMSQAEVTEVNNNPLKIFKNFVSYAGPQGSMYYSVVGEK